MDHHHIDQFSLIDRYLMGRLAAHESAEFEEHFIDCPQCIDRLDTTKDFIEGLRLVASDQALETESYTPRGGARYFRRMISRKSWPLAAGFFLFIVAATVFVVSQARQLRSEIQQAKADSSKLQHQYEESASLAENNYQQAKQKLADLLSQREKELQIAKERAARLLAESRGWVQPRINLLIFVPKSVRGERPTLTLPRSPADFVISVPLEDEVKYEDYRVIILDDRGRRIMMRNGFRPGEHNALSVGLNSSSFKAGNYTLTVEGGNKREGFKPIGNYPFRVIKK